MKIFCDEKLGKILYEDKVSNIENIDCFGKKLSKFVSNTNVSNVIIDELKEMQKMKIIDKFYRIEKFNYIDDYISFIKNINIEKNDFNIINGLFDKGYIYPLESISYNIDLKIIYNLGFIIKDINSPIISYKNTVYKTLDFEHVEFFNNINFENSKKILFIGNDIGYLSFLLKNKNKELYIYDYNEKLFDFTKEHIYKNMNNNNYITCVEDLDDIDFNKFDKIILNTSFEDSFFIFMEYKLYNILDKTHIINYNKIMLKMKEDFRDLIYTGRDSLIEEILINVKEDKETNIHLKSAQLDYVEKINKYLINNKIYYTNYKTFNKFLKYDENIINVLKNNT